MNEQKERVLKDIQTSKNKSFCVLAFLWVTADQTGAVRLCCVDSGVKDEELFGNISSSTIEEMRHSPKMKEIRKKMLQWKRISQCEYCDLKREKWIESLREKKNKKYNKYIKTIVELSDIDTGSTNQQVVFMDIKFSNICNLACRMCYSRSSSARIKYDELLWKTSYKLTSWKWKNTDFDSTLASVKDIRIAWWEPFLDPDFYWFLLYLIEKKVNTNISLSLTTNLSVLEKKYLELFQQFDTIYIGVSCDWYGDMYEYIRIGANWEHFLKNLVHLKKVQSSSNTNIDISMNIVVQIDNLYNLPLLIILCHKLWIRVCLSILQIPSNMQIWIIPQSDKVKVIAHYEKMIERYTDEIDNVGGDLQEIIKVLNSWTEDKKLYKLFLKEKILTDTYVSSKQEK